MSFAFNLYYETTAVWNKEENTAVDWGTVVVGPKSQEELAALHSSALHCRLQDIIELFGFGVPLYCECNTNVPSGASPNNNRDRNKKPDCPNPAQTSLTQLHLVT